MPLSEKILFEKFEKLAKTVKQDFRNKGLVIPVKKSDGSIQIGDYVIKRENSFYYVLSKQNQVVEGPYNLAKTAILVANDLALGRWPDPVLVQNDTWYGYKEFDEQVAQSLAEKARQQHDLDRADFSLYKASIASERKIVYRKIVESKFNKLYKLV